MNRWTVRIVGLLLIVALFLLLNHMKNTLEQLQQQQTSTSSR